MTISIYLYCNKLQHLYNNKFGRTFDNHNAISNCKALINILSEEQTETMPEFTYTLQSIIDRVTYGDMQHHNLTTLSPLIEDKRQKKVGITQGIATKIAGSGLTYGHLKCVYKRTGDEGLSLLLSSKASGKCRVTRTIVYMQTGI